MSTTPVGSPAREASDPAEMPTPQHKDKGKMPASSPPQLLSPNTSFLFDEDSDGELSDDPAPYAGRELINKELTSQETFEPHDTDATKIEATFKIKMTNSDHWFTQKDIIPEKRNSADEDLYKAKDSIFVPDLESSKVPKKDREKKSNVVVRWNKVAENRWERNFKGRHEVFTPSIVLRRFNARTHEYERVHVGQSKLKGIDPNNKKWKDAYNKWIDQISRRSNADYQKKKTRDHWTVAEICAMYTGINDFIHTKGYDAYDTMTTADLTTILNAINAVGGKKRGLDALRGQITSAHEAKNATMAYLRVHAREFRLMIEGGGIVSDDERYPKHVIPLSEFPVKKRPNHLKGMGMVRARVHKPKFRTVGTQTGDDNVTYEDPDDGAGYMSFAAPDSKKRKRGASASDSEESGRADDESEDEEVEHGYGSDPGESSDDEEVNSGEPKDMETEAVPQSKESGLTDQAVKLACSLLEDNSDEPEVDTDDLPPSKKPRLTDHALKLARSLLEDDSE